jgi:hypothetical protein
MRTCGHLDQVDAGVQPDSEIGCSDCLAIGSLWVHLRECMSCGHLGYCEYQPARHLALPLQRPPVMRSIEPGERWWWCYIEEIAFSFGG